MSDYDKSKEWYGVDLDGTLAFYEKWIDGAPIGDPIPAMADRVRQWVKEGKLVKIFTARIADPRLDNGNVEYNKIEAWLLKHFGFTLPVTCTKDCYMKQLWDDRAVGVRPNTGQPDAIMCAAEAVEVMDRKLAEAQERIRQLEGTIDKLQAKRS